MCDEESLKKVEKALNEAITIATKKNIPPLKGSTLLLVSIGSEMKEAKMATKSNSKKITSALDIAFLFANMCSISCENVKYVSFDSRTFKERKPTAATQLLDMTKSYSDEIMDEVKQFYFTFIRGKSLLELWVTTFLPNCQPPLIFV